MALHNVGGKAHNRLNLLGKRFGRLVVEEFSGLNTDKRTAWKCLCDCGNVLFVISKYLRNGNTKSCGCLKKESAAERRKIRPYEALYNLLWHRSRPNGDLTYEQFLEFTEQKECHYCGEKVVWSKYRESGKPFSCNLDRIDSAKGYSVQNCVVCCGTCNVMKMGLSYKVFMERIAKIYDRHS